MLVKPLGSPSIKYITVPMITQMTSTEDIKTKILNLLACKAFPRLLVAPTNLTNFKILKYAIVLRPLEPLGHARLQ